MPFPLTVTNTENSDQESYFMRVSAVNAEVELGGSVNITCQANGMPKPRVKWQEGLFSQLDKTSIFTGDFYFFW